MNLSIIFQKYILSPLIIIMLENKKVTSTKYPPPAWPGLATAGLTLMAVAAGQLSPASPVTAGQTYLLSWQKESSIRTPMTSNSNVIKIILKNKGKNFFEI